MPNEHPDHPDETPPANPPPEQGEGSPVDVQREQTLVTSLTSTFVRQPGATAEQEQERFIDQVLIPALERGPLPEARDLIAEMAAVLEQGLPTVAQATEWTVRTGELVERTGNLLLRIQRSTGELLGPAAAFAMVNIAHQCPKYLHWVIGMTCRTLAAALERGDSARAQGDRKIILEHIGGMAPMPADERFAILLRRYSLTREDFCTYFQKAEKGIEAAGNFGSIQSLVQRRFTGTIRDVLGVERHEYVIECGTNIPEDEQASDIIPRAGLVMEVLSEFITNALKVMEATGTGRKISVSVILRPDGSLVLKVRDDGPGIGDRDPEQLFQAGETTTQRFGGTGKGLTFLKQNIERHFQGSLMAQKNSDTGVGGPGMTFICHLPPAGGWPQLSDE